MNVLPETVLISIIRKLQPFDWLSLQLVSKHVRNVVLEEEGSVESLDILVDFLMPEGAILTEHSFHNDLIDLEHLTLFLLRQFPNLKSLSLRGCPLYMTFVDLIQLTEYLPNLRALNVSQMFNHPKLAPNALVALPKFRNLKVLVADGCWSEAAHPKRIRGSDFPPAALFGNLEEISLKDSDVVFPILDTLRAKNQKLTHLVSFHAGTPNEVSLSKEQLESLIWFLEQHTSLTHVELSRLRLDSHLHSLMIMLRLIALPNLQQLTLIDCWCHEAESQDLPANITINTNDLRSLKLCKSNILTERFLVLLQQRCPEMVVGNA